MAKAELRIHFFLDVSAGMAVADPPDPEENEQLYMRKAGERGRNEGRVILRVGHQKDPTTHVICQKPLEKFDVFAF